MTKSVKCRILVVDDDLVLLKEVKAHLDKLGFVVSTAGSGAQALKIARTGEVDLVVLDINLMDANTRHLKSIDGIEVLRILRESGDVPILMLSSTNIAAVKVMALSLGADDYVSKPFDLQELGARIDAILRRSQGDSQEEKILTFRRLRLDPGERRVFKDGVPIEVTGVEFDLLYTLARRPQHVFTREKLLELAWKEDNSSIQKVVDVHIGHIRKKIEEDPANPVLIVTVRGTGYRFEDVPE